MQFEIRSFFLKETFMQNFLVKQYMVTFHINHNFLELSSLTPSKLKLQYESYQEKCFISQCIWCSLTSPPVLYSMSKKSVPVMKGSTHRVHEACHAPGAW